MIACTFLLGLVQDGNDPDKNFVFMPGTNHGRFCHSQNERHCPQVGSKRWTKSVETLSTDWKQGVDKIS